MAQMVKNLPTMLETWVPSQGWEDPLEKEMASHSSIFSWHLTHFLYFPGPYRNQVSDPSWCLGLSEKVPSWHPYVFTCRMSVCKGHPSSLSLWCLQCLGDALSLMNCPWGADPWADQGSNINQTPGEWQAPDSQWWLPNRPPKSLPGRSTSGVFVMPRPLGGNRWTYTASSSDLECCAST